MCSQSLKRELQMVKETLQAMILQLQPAKDAGEREAAASCVTAGVREAQAWGMTGWGKEGEWPHHQYGCSGLLSPPPRNQCAWINYGDTELRGLSVERWITFALLRLRWEVCTLDHGGGTGLLNLPLNVSQRHLDCVINRSILHRTWKAFHLSPH